MEVCLNLYVLLHALYHYMLFFLFLSVSTLHLH